MFFIHQSLSIYFSKPRSNSALALTKSFKIIHFLNLLCCCSPDISIRFFLWLTVNPINGVLYLVIDFGYKILKQNCFYSVFHHKTIKTYFQNRFNSIINERKLLKHRIAGLFSYATKIIEISTVACVSFFSPISSPRVLNNPIRHLRLFLNAIANGCHTVIDFCTVAIRARKDSFLVKLKLGRRCIYSNCYGAKLTNCIFQVCLVKSINKFIAGNFTIALKFAAATVAIFSCQIRVFIFCNYALFHNVLESFVYKTSVTSRTSRRTIDELLFREIVKLTTLDEKQRLQRCNGYVKVAAVNASI